MIEEHLEILKNYPVGAIRAIRSGGGTAGKTWKITAENGEFLLRRRGGRTSSPALIERDHRLRQFLLEAGLPTTLPVPAADGSRHLTGASGGAYELHPFVTGHFIRRGDERELRSLAKTLAKFHRETRRYRDSMPQLPIDQFGNAAPGAPRSTRIDDPAAIRAALAILLPRLGGGAALNTVGELAGQLAAEYGEAPYRSVDRFVTHGDLNFSNLLFGGDGEVVGLFDFDWTMPGPRIRDIADALHFFAGTMPADADCGNIWDLTAMPEFDRHRSETFMAEYQAESPLEPLELELLPAAHLARVLAFHIEGTAKVPTERKAEFLGRAAVFRNPEIRALFRF